MREYSAIYAYVYTYGCAPDMSEEEWAVYVAKVEADAREALSHLPEGLRVQLEEFILW